MIDARIATLMVASAVFFSCQGSREAAVVREKMDGKTLTLSLKVPPRSTVVSVPGPETPFTADAEGKVDVVIEGKKVPAGKTKIVLTVTPTSGAPIPLEFTHGGDDSAPGEGADCAVILSLDPSGQFRWRGCKGSKYALNGKALGPEVQSLGFTDVFPEQPLGQLFPPGTAITPIDVEVQATDEKGASSRAQLHIETDWREPLLSSLVRTAGKPSQIGGEQLPNDRSLALLIYGKTEAMVLGSGSLKELDLVAIFEPQGDKPAIVQCAAYKCSNGTTREFGVTPQAGELTLYDRRTGAVIEKKAFPAGSAADCPEVELKERLATGAPASMPEMVKWVEGLLAKAP